MLHKETKKRIDDARNILVGQLPLPSDQIELITIALIYKFMDDQDEELRQLGLLASFFKDGLKEYSWQKLMSNEISAEERVTKFINGIEAIQKAKHIPILFRDIFNNTFLKFRDGRTLQLFLKTINGFTYDHSEELGNAFEYLLMVMGTQADNGQFRTPRNIIDFIVEVVDPGKEDTILDPACGTGGFLVSAYKHILRKNTTGYEDYRITLDNYDISGIPINWGDKLSTIDKDRISKSIEGYDITPLMVRLARVNLYLHHFANPRIHEYDTLSFDSRWKDKYTCILANPPFMTPRGFTPAHDRFFIRANKAEVLFSDYILEHLTPDGKAGFIVPEGIIFQNSNDYVTFRKWATETAGLWAVVSLPANVFQPYSGVKTSILFFDRNLARQRSEILLLKIENDGFSLNTNRNPIVQNDLPAALDTLQFCKNDLTKFRSQNNSTYGLKYKLLPRTDFAKLDSYRADAAAWGFIKKQFEKLQKNKSEIDEKLDEHNKVLKKQKDKANKNKLKQTIVSLKEKYDKHLQDFNTTTGYPEDKDNNLTEDTIKKWYVQKIRSQVINYGSQLEISGGISRLLEQSIDIEREYNWNIERYSTSDAIHKNVKYESVQLGNRDIFEIENGGTPDTKNSKYWNGDIPWATLVDLPSKNFITELRNTERKITQQGLNNSSAKILPIDSILVSSRATIGRIAINKIEVSTNQGFKNIIIKDKTKANPYFIAYMLSAIVPQMEELASGATYKEISKSQFSSLIIPLPPINIQSETVEKITQTQRVIDGCNMIIENYEPIFRVKDTWEEVAISDVCEIDPKRPKLEGDIEASFLPMADLGFYEYNISPHQVKKLKETKGYTYFGSKDVLVAKITPCFENGKMGLVRKLKNDIGFGSTEFYVLRANSRILPEFLYFSLCARRFNSDGSKNMSGSAGQQRVTKSFISNYKIHLPSPSVQRKIVSELEQDLKTITEVRKLKEKLEATIKSTINLIWGTKGL